MKKHNTFSLLFGIIKILNKEVKIFMMTQNSDKKREKMQKRIAREEALALFYENF